VANFRGSRSRLSSGRSQRRKTSWNIGTQTSADGGLQAITTSVSQLAIGGAVVLAEGTTLVRTRGEFLAYLETTPGTAVGFHGAFGIAVASSPAFTAGIASLPTPLDEESWDGWLYHKYFGIFSGEGIAAATAATQRNQVNPICAGVRFDVDSKAMRKLSVDMTIYAAVQVVRLGASGTMEWGFNSRSLLKLP